MSLKLANILIKTLQTNQDSKDLIWKNLDLLTCDFASFSPSEKISNEYISFFEGEQLNKFIELMPDDSFIRSLSNDKRISKNCVANNIHLSRTTLMSFGINEFDEKKFSRASIENLSTDEICEKMRFMQLDERCRAFAVLHNYSETIFNDVMIKLFGVFDGKFATVIDSYMANWLSSGSIGSDTVLGSLVENAGKIKSRYTSGSYNILCDLNIFSEKQISLDKSTNMLETLMLAGMSESELIPMVMSTSTPMVAEEVVKYLLLSSPEYMADFFAGSQTRKPNKEIIEEFSKKINSETLSTILDILVSKHKESIPSLPWYIYLMSYMPRIYQTCSNDETPSIIAYQLRDLNKKNAIEFMLVVSPEWESNLTDLIETSETI